MAYADSMFYELTYCGYLIPVCEQDRWLDMASDEVDTLTFGRLTSAFPTVAAHAAKVRKAVCAVAEALYQIDLQQKVAVAQRAADGSYRGAIASVSSGRESISYTVNTASASVYAAAAANENERTKLLGSIVVRYLANIPDAEGVNLLYAGGVRRVSKHNYPV